jgi:hypothetical protein
MDAVGEFHLQAVRDATLAAEKTAQGRMVNDARIFASDARFVSERADAVARSESDINLAAANTASAFAAQAAAFAAECAYAGAPTDGSAGADRDTEAVEYAGQAYSSAGKALATSEATQAADAADQDLQKLRSINSSGVRDLGKPVDPGEDGPLGPLWPSGAPDWSERLKRISADKDAPNRSPITLYFDTSQYSNAEIAEILGRFSDLYRSLGGDALVIDRTETLDPSLVLTPEGV